MTKRDSSYAGFDSAPMHRRPFSLPFPNRSGAASSEDASSSTPGHWPQHPYSSQGDAPTSTMPGTSPYGYASEAPPVPLPSDSPRHYHGEAYPLQSEIQKRHKVHHSHIFKKVLGNQQTGEPDRLMVTEVDRQGEERNRQPEFFFNGIVGHVRSEDGGYINSWDQATRLANYWRRFYNIPEVHENTSWNSSWQADQQPSDNADRTSDAHEVPYTSDMEDNASLNANIGTLPIPSQIHQLAAVLFDILNRDREANAAILEKLENPQDDLNTSPIQVFSAGDLAHLASHLATTSQTLARHAQRFEMEDWSDIDDSS